MRSEIDRARRDLSGTIIGFVGTNSETNRHRFYWFQTIIWGFLHEGGVYEIKGGVQSIELLEIYLVPSLISLVPTQERIGIGFTGF